MLKFIARIGLGAFIISVVLGALHGIGLVIKLCTHTFTAPPMAVGLAFSITAFIIGGMCFGLGHVINDVLNESGVYARLSDKAGEFFVALNHYRLAPIYNGDSCKQKACQKCNKALTSNTGLR